MKISKNKLKQIIKEELESEFEKTISEVDIRDDDPMDYVHASFNSDRPSGVWPARDLKRFGFKPNEKFKINGPPVILVQQSPTRAAVMQYMPKAQIAPQREDQTHIVPLVGEIGPEGMKQILDGRFVDHRLGDTLHYYETHIMPKYGFWGG